MTERGETAKTFIEWSGDKDETLRARYGIGFERVMTALEDGGLLDERRHTNTERYPHQRQLVVSIDGYAWVVPFVQKGDRLFLKTMYPSRRATAFYLDRPKP